MTDTATHTESAAEQKLEGTRAEFRHILTPDGPKTGRPFPRSRTMRVLTSGGATSAMTMVAVALLAARPGIAGRLARATPVINLIRQVSSALR